MRTGLRLSNGWGIRWHSAVEPENIFHSSNSPWRNIFKVLSYSYHLHGYALEKGHCIWGYFHLRASMATERTFETVTAVFWVSCHLWDSCMTAALREMELAEFLSLSLTQNNLQIVIKIFRLWFTPTIHRYHLTRFSLVTRGGSSWTRSHKAVFDIGKWTRESLIHRDGWGNLSSTIQIHVQVIFSSLVWLDEKIFRRNLWFYIWIMGGNVPWSFFY